MCIHIHTYIYTYIHTCTVWMQKLQVYLGNITTTPCSTMPWPLQTLTWTHGGQYSPLRYKNILKLAVRNFSSKCIYVWMYTYVLIYGLIFSSDTGGVSCGHRFSLSSSPRYKWFLILYLRTYVCMYCMYVCTTISFAQDVYLHLY